MKLSSRLKDTASYAVIGALALGAITGGGFILGSAGYAAAAPLLGLPSAAAGLGIGAVAAPLATGTALLGGVLGGTAGFFNREISRFMEKDAGILSPEEDEAARKQQRAHYARKYGNANTPTGQMSLADKFVGKIGEAKPAAKPETQSNKVTNAPKKTP